LPDSGDLATPDVLGVTLITFPDPSMEAFGNLAVNLDPGSYAVVFGSGLFGTNGRGAAVANGTDIGDPNYILWQPGNGWLDMPPIFSNFRFVVEGQFVPEPSSLALGLVAVTLFVAGRRRIDRRFRD
jgi:MYXO-CTERM domain-containing protein